MRMLVFSARPYDREFLETANSGRHELEYTEARLEERTAALAQGFPAVCCFVSDRVDAPVLRQFQLGGTRLIVLRSTGFNNVDLEAAAQHGITVMRVCRYSPYAVAEFAVGMALAMNRKIHRAYQRVRDGNFRLDGLMGSDFNGKTVGVVGTGRIGAIFARIMKGFGCRLLGYDQRPSADCLELGMAYTGLDQLLADSDIVSLHVPLTPETYHLINAKTIAMMKPGATLVNTGRGALVDARALIPHLKKCYECAVCLDVYEEEEQLFYRDLSDQVITDDTISRLLTFPNVLITGHQAFFTREAIQTIAETTIKNLDDFTGGRRSDNEIRAENANA